MRRGKLCFPIFYEVPDQKKILCMIYHTEDFLLYRSTRFTVRVRLFFEITVRLVEQRPQPLMLSF